MPFEVLLDIYEFLDRNSLTNVAKTHPLNLGAAEYIYRNKYAIETFDIRGVKVFDGIWHNDNNNLDAVLNSLEVFGHLITKLRLNYSDFDNKQRDRLNQYIKNYTTNVD